MNGTLLEWNGITAHVEYIQDITEKKIKDAQNLSLLEQLGSIMEHVPGALCLYKAEGDTLKPINHNRAFYETFGFSEQQVIIIDSPDSETKFLNVHPDDLDELKTKVQKSIINSLPFSHTYRQYNKPKHRYIWIYMRGVVTNQPDGTKLLYASYTDISDERTTQKELHEAQRKMEVLQKQAQISLQEYQTLVNTIPGAIVLYEIIGDTIQTKYYSDGLCTLSGYSRKDRDKHNNIDAAELIDDRDAPTVRKAVYEAIKNQSNLDLSYRIKTKNGSSRYVHLNATYVNTENGNPQFHAVFSDIEEFKQLEKALLEQQLRYEVAIKSSGMNIWEYDINSDCLTVVSNSSRIKQNCYSIENYIQSTIDHGYVREDSIPTFYSIFEKLKQGDEEIIEDIWYKTTDEAGWWCERVIYTTVFDEKGKPQKAFGAGRDVTREKEAIQKFQEELHYREAIQGTNLGSIKINLTQNTILEGASPFPIVTEWIQNGNADHYFEKNAACIKNIERHANYINNFNRRSLINRFNGGDFYLSMDFTRLLNEDHICWLQYDVHLIKNPENNDIIAFIVAHDITDEHVIKMVMETVTKTDYERLIVVDGSINSAKDFSTNVEKPLFSTLDIYEEQCVKVIRENVCKKDQNRLIKACKINHIFNKIKNGDPYKLNYSVEEKNGEIRRKQLQFTLISYERKTFLMARIDVNEVFIQQEQSKRELKKALHEAQSAAKAKTDFLSRMSHDIRTPLNAIIGLANLGACSNSMSEMREYYHEIEYSGKYLLSIINDVLYMSRIESQQLVLDPSIVFLPEFIHSTLVIVEPLAAAKNIHLEIQQSQIKEQYLWLDTTYVKQVVINLLSNAIKFTPKGGHIELIFENISRTQDYIKNRMTVRDNGIGISADFIPKIFIPFEQENTTDDNSRNGTGLGMSIVKSIIDLMGGSIKVESTQGKGSSFIVEWAFKIAKAQDFKEQQATCVNIDDLVGIHILLCEDHDLNIKITKKLLEKAGIIVTVAKNGQLGVELFEQSDIGEFDAILMDIRMPVMDGLIAAKTIRSLKRLDAKQIPIIAMTANAFSEDIKQTHDIGMNAHLSKPIDSQLLYKTLLETIF